MIPQAHITAWRAFAPWVDDAQVEQDLVLSRALIELFADDFLSDNLALRGGTSLHKLVIQRPFRYSEDIDLVQMTPGPIGPVLDAIRAKLDGWLGKPRRSRGPDSVSLVYRFVSEIPPIRPLRLKVEINTREHFRILGRAVHRFDITNPWFTDESQVETFELDELLATKLRALYQRRKGRDLFDLWLCIQQEKIDPDRIVGCFIGYMDFEGRPPSRAQFEQNLRDKEADDAFLSDIRPLLRPGIDYDPARAIGVVRETLVRRLPGKPSSPRCDRPDQDD